MEIYTIGFTQWSAEGFFGALTNAGVRRLVDVRLHNTSQLAGFAKRDDLVFFLRELASAEYVHEPLLAPTAELLDAYKKKRISWDEYAEVFGRLLVERQIETAVPRELFEEPAALLCSEHGPERCHRRLVVEYLAAHWGDVEAVHLT